MADMFSHFNCFYLWPLSLPARCLQRLLTRLPRAWNWCGCGWLSGNADYRITCSLLPVSRAHPWAVGYGKCRIALADVLQACWCQWSSWRVICHASCAVWVWCNIGTCCLSFVCLELVVSEQRTHLPYFPENKSHIFTWNSTFEKWDATYNRDATCFQDFVNLTVRHACAYTVYTKSHIRVSLGLVEGNFWSAMTDGQNWGCDL